MSDAQGDLTPDPERVTHSSNRNETVTINRNENFEQDILSNCAIPVMPLAIKPGIEKGIAPIVLASQTLLDSAMKKFVSDVNCIISIIC